MIRLVLTELAKKEKRKVVNPETMKRIGDDGVLIQKVDSYWKNRINDKDVEVFKKEKKVSSK